MQVEVWSGKQMENNFQVPVQFTMNGIAIFLVLCLEHALDFCLKILMLLCT